MLIDQTTFEQIYARMTVRDESLDGLVFVGVRTTGIYCRPVCPARIPLARNVRFFASAAAAERNGFRPCLRCRPETAPFCPAWNGTRTTVERALKLIDAGALDDRTVDDLADRVGIGTRHLTRLFKHHIGASPTQVAKTRRIQRAKRLLNTTDLSLTEIAEQSGFKSLRRMCAAFVELYGKPPAFFRTQHQPRKKD